LIDGNNIYFILFTNNKVMMVVWNNDDDGKFFISSSKLGILAFLWRSNGLPLLAQLRNPDFFF